MFSNFYPIFLYSTNKYLSIEPTISKINRGDDEKTKLGTEMVDYTGRKVLPGETESVQGWRSICSGIETVMVDFRRWIWFRDGLGWDGNC